MTIYNYFINFLEGLLLSSFMAYYFNVKRKKMYILITTIICFFEISISNYYNTFDQLLIFIVIATLFISLLKLKTESLFEKNYYLFYSRNIFILGKLIVNACYNFYI